MGAASRAFGREWQCTSTWLQGLANRDQTDVRLPCTQRLLGLSMEDPTPALDTPEVFGVSKPGCLRAPN